MKKYYAITILAIILIAVLQGYSLFLQYQNYMRTEMNIVESKLKVSIDEEYASRAHKRHQPFKNGKQRLFFKMMTDKEVKDINPPKKHIISLKGINIQDLRDRGIVETEADVLGLLSKDVVSQTGNVINLQQLSFRFRKNLKEDYLYTLYLLDENNKVINYFGQKKTPAGWRLCKPVAVGLKPLRFVSVKVKIPLSSFIKNSIVTLLFSVLLALVVILCVGYQLTVIRKREEVLKSRAISIHGVIHDLKSPLASVLLLLSFVKDRISDDELCCLLEKSEMQIKKISNRIKAILITAKADENKLLLNKVPIDLGMLIYNVKEQVLLNFEDKHPTINIRDLREKNKIVYVDVFLIENAIRNLIENAVKYSSMNPHVDVCLNEDGISSIISVADFGIGVEKKYHKKIFEQFYRIPNGQSNSGFGIGLAMVKSTVNAHNGNIKVKSELGKGSTFTILLPLSIKK